MKKDKLRWLRRWFVVHFVVDMVVGGLLMLRPSYVLSFLKIDGGVGVARLVGAALLGIGGESFLGRNSNRKGFLGMLRLKIIWSSMAMLGLGWGIMDKELDLLIGSGLIGVFLMFNILWVYLFML